MLSTGTGVDKYDLNRVIGADMVSWYINRGIRVTGQLPFDKRMVDTDILEKNIS